MQKIVKIKACTKMTHSNKVQSLCNLRPTVILKGKFWSKQSVQRSCSPTISFYHIH